MKTIRLLMVGVLLVSFSANTQAQFFKKLTEKAKKKVEREAEKRSERRVDKGIDKVFDKAEEGLDGTSDGVKKNKKASVATGRDSVSSASAIDGERQRLGGPSSDPSVLTWSKYDFVPGTEILFEDNHEGEQNGEFPGKWDLVAGVVENANFNGENVIYIRETGNFPNGIAPLLKNPSADDLPDEFTLEFDCYFQKNVFNSNYRIYFYNARNKAQKRLNDMFVTVDVNQLTFGRQVAVKQYPNTSRGNINRERSLWRHIAVSFNKRALKVYMDDTRLLNIPNITDNPTGITLSSNHAKVTNNQFIKNIRIAKGAVPLYDKILTDGRFVTTGIKFDVNRSTLKAESAGTINYVVQMMQDNPDWRFCVEGHTDSDGAENTNQTLSERRAEAVREALIGQGIAADRLTCKGWGESKPVLNNDTPEGKAQNRRVEFVKL